MQKHAKVIAKYLEFKAFCKCVVCVLQQLASSLPRPSGEPLNGTMPLKMEQRPNEGSLEAAVTPGVPVEVRVGVGRVFAPRGLQN